MSKLLILGPAWPYRGGIAASTEQLARTLQHQGHDMEICTFRLQYPSLLFPGKSQFSEAPAPNDLKIYRSIHAINPLNWIALGRRLGKGRYNQLVVRYWTPFLAPALGAICRFAKRKGMRVTALVDNLVPHERHFWDRPLTRFFVRSVDDFVAMSHQVMDEIAAFCPKKEVRYSPHPVYDIYGKKMDRNLAAKILDLDGSTHWALFFGLVRPYKGLDWLLEAWAMCKERGKTVGLKVLVAGEFYENEDKYRQQIVALGLEHDVVIHNRFIPDEQVAAYFSLADVAVQPYKSATQSGITQIAYHFEIPMIVTNVGGLSEIVPDGKAGIVAAPNPQAVAEAIERFYGEGPVDRFAIGLQGEKGRFSWDALADAVQG
ncbi:MAG: glycosyltransferase [Prevotellaceae bacterium]|jgi:glycosyltransferase involved in cell wall biosynthesis|nr:glycosyltransferase [Prevotellaceae bacterium]